MWRLPCSSLPPEQARCRLLPRAWRCWETPGPRCRSASARCAQPRAPPAQCSSSGCSCSRLPWLAGGRGPPRSPTSAASSPCPAPRSRTVTEPFGGGGAELRGARGSGGGGEGWWQRLCCPRGARPGPVLCVGERRVVVPGEREPLPGEPGVFGELSGGSSPLPGWRKEPFMQHGQLGGVCDLLSLWTPCDLRCSAFKAPFLSIGCYGALLKGISQNEMLHTAWNHSSYKISKVKAVSTHLRKPWCLT